MPLLDYHVVEAEYVSGYSIRLKFADGNAGVIDLERELWGEVFTPLKELEFFKQFRIHPEFHTLIWPNGADFAPEFLYDNTRTLFPATKKLHYRRTFYLPPSRRWEIEGSLPDIYFTSSRTLVEGVVYGQYHESIEGIAATYLLRHYLELRLKYALFHARWLKTWNEDQKADFVTPIKKTHNVEWLWSELVVACKTRIPAEVWGDWDTNFVNEAIQDFHAIDPMGDSIRYGNIKEIGTNNNVEYDPRDILHQDAETIGLHDQNIGIDFRSLLSNMTHVHDVLEAIDDYLLETHGQNEEWESILNSY